MIKILLDTNFLVYCAKQRIDYLREINNLINQEHKLLIFSSVIEELEKLAEKSKKSRDKEAALLALELLNGYLEGKKIKILKTEKKADDAIIEFSKKSKDAIVATADKKLKNELGSGAGILTIRQKKHLKLE